MQEFEENQQQTPINRRKFIHRSAIWSLASAGVASFFSYKWVNAQNVFKKSPNTLPGKHPDLVILNDRPWNMETPPHLLQDLVTPADKLFVRNNGLMPEIENPENWTLEIGGESVENPKTYTLSELKNAFSPYTYQLTLECGGNGRAEFDPPAKGNQWTTGAVGCPKWTGIRLRDLLEDVGVKSDAVYVAYYGKDLHLSGDPEKVVISRGVPLKKAMEEESLLAWSMNGEDLPLANGFPLRLVFGGWPGSTSGKWVHKIVVRNKVHDGPKMGGQSYRVPCYPVAPGTQVADEDMCIIEAMPVKSLITSPKTGGILQKGRSLTLSGKAWTGKGSINKVEVSMDYGRSWQETELSESSNRYAWVSWQGSLSFPEKGYFEIWARASDTEGRRQPILLPGWNPKGYLNNACHRIAVKVV
ncbi:MAG: sulfite oxidase [Bacteroidota bacterium]